MASNNFICFLDLANRASIRFLRRGSWSGLVRGLTKRFGPDFKILRWPFLLER